MSVVNKMLQDLEDRSGEENAESADYEPEQKRVKYLSFFIIGVLTVAACYFSYRALGPEYFKSTFKAKESSDVWRNQGSGSKYKMDLIIVGKTCLLRQENNA